MPNINTSMPSINIGNSSNNSATSKNSGIDLGLVIQAIIEILSTIANNTSAIQKIADLLSERLKIDTSDVNVSSSKQSAAQLKSKLRTLSNNISSANSNIDNSDLISLRLQ